jgi:hypothetical protein
MKFIIDTRRVHTIRYQSFKYKPLYHIDIAEILLKVALKTPKPNRCSSSDNHIIPFLMCRMAPSSIIYEAKFKH